VWNAFATDLESICSTLAHARCGSPCRGYLPLSVEEIGTSRDGHRLVSLCQYGEQNGDLMRDCDLVFMVTDLSDGAAAEPVSYPERLPGDRSGGLPV
jgi:hypothetical protein